MMNNKDIDRAFDRMNDKKGMKKIADALDQADVACLGDSEKLNITSGTIEASDICTKIHVI